MSKKVEIKLGFDKAVAQQEAKELSQLLGKELTGNIKIDTKDAVKKMQEFKKLQASYASKINSYNSIKQQAEKYNIAPQQVLSKVWNQATASVEKYRKVANEADLKSLSQPNNHGIEKQYQDAIKMAQKYEKKVASIEKLQKELGDQPIDTAIDSAFTKMKEYSKCVDQLMYRIHKLDEAQESAFKGTTQEALGQVKQMSKEMDSLTTKAKQMSKEKSKISASTQNKENNPNSEVIKETSQSGLSDKRLNSMQQKLADIQDKMSKVADNVKKNTQPTQTDGKTNTNDSTSKLDTIAGTVDKISQKVQKDIKTNNTESQTSNDKSENTTLSVEEGFEKIMQIVNGNLEAIKEPLNKIANAQSKDSKEKVTSNNKQQKEPVKEVKQDSYIDRINKAITKTLEVLPDKAKQQVHDNAAAGKMGTQKNVEETMRKMQASLYAVKRNASTQETGVLKNIVNSVEAMPKETFKGMQDIIKTLDSFIQKSTVKPKIEKLPEVKQTQIQKSNTQNEVKQEVKTVNKEVQDSNKVDVSNTIDHIKSAGESIAQAIETVAQNINTTNTEQKTQNAQVDTPKNTKVTNTTEDKVVNTLEKAEQNIVKAVEQNKKETPKVEEKPQNTIESTLKQTDKVIQRINNMFAKSGLNDTRRQKLFETSTLAKDVKTSLPQYGKNINLDNVSAELEKAARSNLNSMRKALSNISLMFNQLRDTSQQELTKTIGNFTINTKGLIANDQPKHARSDTSDDKGDSESESKVITRLLAAAQQLQNAGNAIEQSLNSNRLALPEGSKALTVAKPVNKPTGTQNIDVNEVTKGIVTFLDKEALKYKNAIKDKGVQGNINQAAVNGQENIKTIKTNLPTDVTSLSQIMKMLSSMSFDGLRNSLNSVNTLMQNISAMNINSANKNLKVESDAYTAGKQASKNSGPLMLESDKNLDDALSRTSSLLDTAFNQELTRIVPVLENVRNTILRLSASNFGITGADGEKSPELEQINKALDNIDLDAVDKSSDQLNDEFISLSSTIQGINDKLQGTKLTGISALLENVLRDAAAGKKASDKDVNELVAEAQQQAENEKAGYNFSGMTEEQEAIFREAQNRYIASINRVIEQMDKLASKEKDKALAEGREDDIEGTRMDQARLTKLARQTKGSTTGVPLDTINRATQIINSAMQDGSLNLMSDFRALISTLQAVFKEGNTELRNASRTGATKDTNVSGQAASGSFVGSSSSRETRSSLGKAEEEVESYTSRFYTRTAAMFDRLAARFPGSKISKQISKWSDNLRDASERANETTDEFEQLAELSQRVNSSTAKISNGYKEVGRVVQGILISRFFYAWIRGISNVIASVKELICQFENANVSFAVLLKDQEKANDLMAQLQDFAAVTPFNNQEADQASQMLLAYGFEAKNVLAIMRDLSDAAAATGDTTAFQRIARALGQINTKGKLAVQEILQLTEAGIPTYQILQEELGLTADQMANIGKQGIPAAAAIRAILNGIEKRFGGTAEALSQTMTGLWSTIKDDASFFVKDFVAPFTKAFREVLAYFANGLDALRQIVAKSGIGGVLEAIIPRDLLEDVRLLIANLHILFQIVVMCGQALSPFFSAALMYVVDVLNLIIPIISAAGYVLSHFAALIGINTQGLYNMAKVLAMITVAVLVYKGFMKLTAVLIKTFEATKLVVLGVIELTKGLCTVEQFASVCGATFMKLLAILAAVAAYFLVFKNLIDGIFGAISKSMTNAFNIDPNSYFPKIDLGEDTEEVNNFNEAFNTDAIKNWSDAVTDASKKAKKAADNLQSFDEVFRITEESADDGADAADEIDPSSLLGGMDGKFPGYKFDPIDWDHIFNIPGVDDNLTSLQEALDKLNPVNNVTKAIDNITSGLSEFGTFLSNYEPGMYTIEDPFGFAEDGWPSLNTALDGVTTFSKGLQDTVAGAMAIVYGIFTGDWELIKEGWITLVDGLGEILWGLVETVQGVLDIFGDLFINIGEWLKDLDWGSLTDGLGDVFIGLGEAWKGFVDGLAESIHGIVDIIVGIFTLDGDKILTGLEEVGNGAWTILTGMVTGIIDILKGLGEIILGLLGYDFWGPALEDWMSSVLAFLDGVWDEVCNFFSTVGSGIGEFFSSLWNIFTTYLSSLLDTIATFGSSIFDAVSTFFGQIWDAITTFFSSIWDTISTAVESVFSIIDTFISQIWEAVCNFFSSIWTSIVDFFTNSNTSFSDFIGNIWNSITKFVGDVLQAIGGFISGMWNTFTSFVSSIISAIGTFLGSILSSIGQFISNIWNSITNFFSGIGSTIANAFSSLCSAVEDLWNTIWNAIGTFWDNVKNWASNLASSSSSWASSVISTLVNAVVNFGSSVINSLGNLLNSIFSWGGNLVRGAVTIASNFVKGFIDKISELPKMMLDIGKNIVSGIWSGISGGLSGLNNNISSMCGGMVSSLKAALGIHSPSRVMRDEIGAYIVPGIAEGILSNIDVVSKAMQKVSDTMADTPIDNTIDLKLDAIGDASGLNQSLKDTADSFIDRLYTGFTWLAGKVRELVPTDLMSNFDQLSARASNLQAGNTESIPNVNGLLYKTDVDNAYAQKKQVKLDDEDIEALVNLSAESKDSYENNPTGTPGELHLHVGVLVADDNGLKKLSKELKRIQQDDARGRR